MYKCLKIAKALVGIIDNTTLNNAADIVGDPRVRSANMNISEILQLQRQLQRKERLALRPARVLSVAAVAQRPHKDGALVDYSPTGNAFSAFLLLLNGTL